MGQRYLKRAMERALTQVAFGRDACMRCGDAPARGGRMLVLYPGDRVRHCEACGLLIDGDGRAVGARQATGTVAVKILDLRSPTERAPGERLCAIEVQR